MDSIILAGGKGLRFFSSGWEKRPLPGSMQYPIPKALYPVRFPCNENPDEMKPIIYWLVKSLTRGGIERIFIGTGYLHDKIRGFVQHELADPNVVVVPPDDDIDYERGPLFTLAATMKWLDRRGEFKRKTRDKIIMVVPSDLIIDTRAIWYVVGPAARSMMASSKIIHFFVEDRWEKQGETKQSAGIKSTRLRDWMPVNIQHSYPDKILESRIVPIIALHENIIKEACELRSKGFNKLSEFLKYWFNENFQNSMDFESNVDVIPTSRLGQNFFWYDIDVFDVVKKNNL
ncbi:MAG: hypothetical protein ACTSWN_13350 [Promethearchaeota archaeon]